MKVICLHCESEFKTIPSRIKDGKGKFCSKPCANTAWKGKSRSPETQIKRGQRLSVITEFKKGQASWNKGMDYMKDDAHPMWKGDTVGYQALHSWINRKLGSPRKCSKCKTTTAKKFEWANLSQKYKRDLTDWKRLCTKCHNKFDDIVNRGWKTRKGETFAY